MGKMCDRCPRRDMARLFRALGEASEAERIESEGCVWWWEVEQTNLTTGKKRNVEVCGAQEAMPQFLTAYGEKIIEALMTAQTNTDVIDKGLRGIASSVLARQALGQG